jgi:hypothetical protein
MFCFFPLGPTFFSSTCPNLNVSFFFTFRYLIMDLAAWMVTFYYLLFSAT